MKFNLILVVTYLALFFFSCFACHKIAVEYVFHCFFFLFFLQFIFTFLFGFGWFFYKSEAGPG